MLLGKRPRRPVRRTTSLTELTLDLSSAEGERHQRPLAGTGVTGNDSDDNNRSGGRRQKQQQPHHVGHQTQHQHQQYQHQGLCDRYLSSPPVVAPPRNPRRYSGNVIEQAHFLRACGLCKQRLGPGKDTFMYRGEVAFCSLECRQQQIIQDERKEKCSPVTMKRDPLQPPTKPEASR